MIEIYLIGVVIYIAIIFFAVSVSLAGIEIPLLTPYKKEQIKINADKVWNSVRIIDENYGILGVFLVSVIYIAMVVFIGFLWPFVVIKLLLGK